MNILKPAVLGIAAITTVLGLTAHVERGPAALATSRSSRALGVPGDPDIPFDPVILPDDLVVSASAGPAGSSVTITGSCIDKLRPDVGYVEWFWPSPIDTVDTPFDLLPDKTFRATLTIPDLPVGTMSKLRVFCASWQLADVPDSELGFNYLYPNEPTFTIIAPSTQVPATLVATL